MNALIRYFDLNEKIRATRPQAIAKDGKGRLHWLPQYLTLLFAIFIEPFLANYREHNTFEFDSEWGRLLFAAIIAFAVFPQVYKGVVSDRRPLIVQLGVIFTSGLGWQTFLDTVNTGMKAAGQ